MGELGIRALLGYYAILVWCAEFSLEILLQILLGKTGAKLNLKIMLKSLHIRPNLHFLTKMFFVQVRAFTTTVSRLETFTVQDEDDYQKRVLENPGDLSAQTVREVLMSGNNRSE